MITIDEDLVDHVVDALRERAALLRISLDPRAVRPDPARERIGRLERLAADIRKESAA